MAIKCKANSNSRSLPDARGADACIKTPDAVIGGYGADGAHQAGVAIQSRLDVVLAQDLQSLCGRRPQEGLCESSTDPREEIHGGLRHAVLAKGT